MYVCFYSLPSSRIKLLPRTKSGQEIARLFCFRRLGRILVGTPAMLSEVIPWFFLVPPEKFQIDTER
jgi:hypothetical protein